MEYEKLRSSFVGLDATISDVLEVLNAGVFGIALMCDEDQKLVGIFTDSDMRRVMLSGAGLKKPARGFANAKFSFARQTQGHQAAIGLLSANRRHVPILNELDQPVDMVSLTEIWKLGIASPNLAGNEIKYVADCMASGWISSQGGYVKKFEQALADYLETDGVLAVSNGTCALHLAMAALDIGPGDEVLVPNLTFGATANAVIHCGATPVFVDVDPIHWCIDPEAITAAITPKSKAIIPVHIYGHPAEMQKIMAVAREHNLFVVEDCAEAIGAKVEDTHIGNFGDIGCFSFFANKIITTGEGGAVSSKHPHLIERMKLLMNHGMNPARRYWHLEVGYNYRMTNMQAAIGLAQMERIDQFITRRNEIAKRYHDGLSDLDWLALPQQANWAERINWLYSISVKDHAPVTRVQLMEELALLNIETREIFPPLNIQPAFGSTARQLFPVTSTISECSMSLPTSVEMDDGMVDHVVASIRQIGEKFNQSEMRVEVSNT